ncbi:histidine phosphatase family protein [Tahibacter amnicola]|uniref:Histidine phosphatase family protein n=1 Tax=Tahibacter amnicola TaxID=2976241 RepID=A0ABY6BHL9_9GAMM|nr:histidine phosphatase family protein [Tahibacter amnicola]UXI69345.1 histidine phosphatase family protein [Tahibacter amnicola]
MLLGRAFVAWNDGHLADVMPESLDQFRERAARAARRAGTAAGDGTALVVSSGGAIARCAQALLDLDEPRTVELNLQLSNSGIVELWHEHGRWTLRRWNDLPHFAPSDLAQLRSFV